MSEPPHLQYRIATREERPGCEEGGDDRDHQPDPEITPPETVACAVAPSPTSTPANPSTTPALPSRLSACAFIVSRSAATCASTITSDGSSRSSSTQTRVRRGCVSESGPIATPTGAKDTAKLRSRVATKSGTCFQVTKPWVCRRGDRRASAPHSHRRRDGRPWEEPVDPSEVDDSRRIRPAPDRLRGCSRARHPREAGSAHHLACVAGPRTGSCASPMLRGPPLPQ